MTMRFKIGYIRAAAILAASLQSTAVFAIPRSILIPKPAPIPAPTPTPSSAPQTPSKTPILKSKAIVPFNTAFKFNLSRVITDSYLRMNEPNVILNMASKVESGSAPMSSLQYLAGKSDAAALVKIDWRSSIAALGLASNSSANQVQSSSGSTGSTWNAVETKMRPLYASTPPPFAPTSMILGEMKDGTVVKQQILFIVPDNCSFSASVSSSTYGCVKVIDMVGYSGQWNAGAIQGPVLAQRAAGTLQVVAGEVVAVNVEVTSPNPTKFSGAINVYGTAGAQGWQVSIPVSATYTILGPLNTVYAVPDRNIQCLAGQTIQMPLQLVNLNASSTSGTVTFSGLPSSVTVTPVSFTIPGSGAVTQTVTFTVPTGAQENIGANVVVSVSPTSGLPSTTDMTFSIFDPIHEFDIEGYADTGYFSLSGPTLGICTDGTYYFNCVAADTPDFTDDSIRFGFGFFDKDNTAYGEVGSDSFGASLIGHTATHPESLTGTSKWVYDNYLGAVNLTPFVFLQVDPEGEYGGTELTLTDPPVTLYPF